MNKKNRWLFGIAMVLLLSACQQKETPAPVAAAPAVKPEPACPNVEPGVAVGPMGCPCDMTVQLQFKSNSAELMDEDKAKLDTAGETLQRLHWITGTIEGFTDANGHPEHNQQLSEARATTVRDYLQSKGVGDQRMTVKGYGEANPIADNSTP